MISLLNIVMLCLIQDGGFVVTDGPTVSAFVITERPQANVLQKPEPASEPVVEDKPAADAATVLKPRYFFRFFTADWCGYCKKFKNDGKLKELQALTEVVIVDTQKDKSYGSMTLPTIRLYDRETDRQLNEWVGYQNTMSMKARYLEKVSAAPKPPARDNSFYGRKGTSHESRETLIQHLLKDGIHQGRHTRESLDGLSDHELVELHDEEHEDAGDVVEGGLWRKK